MKNNTDKRFLGDNSWSSASISFCFTTVCRLLTARGDIVPVPALYYPTFLKSIGIIIPRVKILSNNFHEKTNRQDDLMSTKQQYNNYFYR